MVVGDVTTAASTVVLGGGPGGYVAAIRAAQLGQSVTLINEGPTGGTCLNSGCIPLKALVSAARRYRSLQDESLAPLGISLGSKPTFDWSQMQSWKGSVVERLSSGVTRLLAGHKIEMLPGNGWFLNDHELRIEGEYGSHRYAFEKLILATGAVALPLPDLPFDAQVLTPQQALVLTSLPSQMSIVGDDYIALELSTLFQSLGVSVTLLTAADRLLPVVDPAAARLVQAGLRKLGLTIVTGAHSFKKTDDTLAYSVGSATKTAPLPVIVSNGVRPNLAKLNLDAANLKLEGDRLTLDAGLQTVNPNILMAGDCTGGVALATTAIRQAKLAAASAGGQRVAYAPQTLPQVIHTTPEVAYVGLSSEGAKQAGYEIVSGRFPLAANGRALTLVSENGVALTVAEAGSGILLGMTLVGPQAGDLIMEAALAIEMGATLTDLAEILHPHPGLPEMVLESVENALSQAIHILP